jgi:peptidyl-prolyl cis-trans isomerase A (cyclophilin A)
MDVVDKLYSGYGDGPPQGGGPSQQSISNLGNKYLADEFPKLDYIRSARVLEN